MDHIKDICPVVSLVEKKKRSNQEIDYKITPFLRPVIFTTQSTFSLFFIFYWWEKYCNMARFSLFALGYRTYFRKLQNIFTGFYDNCKAILIINSHNPPFYHNQTKVCLKREEINHSQYSVICSRKIPGKLASRPWFWIKRPKMTIYNGMFVFWGGKMSLPFQFQTRIHSENFTIFFLTLKLKISYS